MGDNHEMVSHRDDQVVENALFLLGTGLHMELVAKRLGMTASGLERKLERRGFAKSDTNSVQGTRSRA